MNGIKTFARSNSTEAINAAFRNAQVSNVPEVAVAAASFLASATSTSIPHTLGKVPEFASWLGETDSRIYASAADKLLWTADSIVLKCSAIDNGILKVEAR